MPNPNPAIATAARKRNAAARREADAARLRSEADELENQYRRDAVDAQRAAR